MRNIKSRVNEGILNCCFSCSICTGVGGGLHGVKHTDEIRKIVEMMDGDRVNNVLSGIDRGGNIRRKSKSCRG